MCGISILKLSLSFILSFQHFLCRTFPWRTCAQDAKWTLLWHLMTMSFAFCKKCSPPQACSSLPKVDEAALCWWRGAMAGQVAFKRSLERIIWLRSRQTIDLALGACVVTSCDYFSMPGSPGHVYAYMYMFFISIYTYIHIHNTYIHYVCIYIYLCIRILTCFEISTSFSSEVPLHLELSGTSGRSWTGRGLRDGSSHWPGAREHLSPKHLPPALRTCHLHC